MDKWRAVVNTVLNIQVMNYNWEKFKTKTHCTGFLSYLQCEGLFTINKNLLLFSGPWIITIEQFCFLYFSILLIFLFLH